MTNNAQTNNDPLEELEKALSELKELRGDLSILELDDVQKVTQKIYTIIYEHHRKRKGIFFTDI